ncbi:MAG: hypothetical protein AAF696_13535 [Bacteroidota bacterium]
MNRTLHKHTLTIFLVLLSTLIHVPRAHAQDPNVRLMADSTFIGLGDPLELTLSVIHKEGAEFTFPVFGDTLGGFEVLDVSAIQLSQKEQLWERAQKITLIRFDTGSFQIPAQTLMYQSSGTAEPSQISSNPLLIDVMAIEVDTTQTYRPIKGIADVGYSWAEIWPWLLIALLLAAVIAYVIYRLRRKVEIPEIRIAPPPVPPHEIAMKKLAHLESEKLWQKGELKEYYVQLTGVIREYIEGLFHIPALESITDEIVRDLKKTATPEKQLEKLAPFLQMADLAKFAKFKPTEKENMENMEVAREFIRETKKFYSKKEELLVEESDTEEIGKEGEEKIEEIKEDVKQEEADLKYD